MIGVTNKRMIRMGVTNTDNEEYEIDDYDKMEECVSDQDNIDDDERKDGTVAVSIHIQSSAGAA